MEMAHSKKYRSFKCLVRPNCVSPFLIILLIRSKNKKETVISQEVRIFVLGSEYVTYKQRNTLCFIKFY